VQTLDWSRNLPVARAKQLRDLALEFDIVILHIHPFDPVPAIAFASGASPPLILLNHAGFSFWIGRDIADVVACLRPSSRQIAIGRRGIGPDRCVRLAIPVSVPEKEPSRSEARAKLALSNDAVILFTVSSSPSKYVPFEPGWSLVQLITSVAQANKQVQVLAIGPNDEGIWREAREQTGGRVRALGQRPDVGLYERAADIYIDSFPVTSPTSFLEAGSYGLPVISFCPHRARAAVLCADDFFVNDLIVRTDTAESFRAELTRLTEDTAARETLGRTMAKGVMATHGPEAFAKQLLETYSRVALMRQTGRFSVPPGTVGRVGALDNSLVQMQQTANLPRSLWDLTKAHVDAFPPGRRKWLPLKVDLVLSLPLRLIAAGRRRRLEPTGCANLNAP
jgi:glycosyltransferase involved in cell wall biosynthesis